MLSRGWRRFWKKEPLISVKMMKQAAPLHASAADPARVSDHTLRAFAGYQMKRAMNLVHADLKHTLAPFDLRMVTFSALVLIQDNPGLRQSQLAAAMDIERPNLVVIIDELEGRGLIVRKPDPTDRRAQCLFSTPKGQTLYQDSVRAVRAHEQALFQGVDAEMRETLSKLLKLLRNTPGRTEK